VCRDDKLATDLIDAAVRNPIDPTDTSMYLIDTGPLAQPATVPLRRVRDHRPDLHARVVAKELSAHPTIIKAGFRTLAE
jgi:hypothetical protein